MNAAPRFAWLWTVAVAAAALAFVVHLAVRHEVTQLSYEVGRQRARHRELLEAERNLAIEAESLREPTRLRQFARRTLDMEAPDPSQIITLGGEREEARPTAGRAR